MEKKLKAVEELLYPVHKVKSSELLPDFDFTPQQEYAIVVDTPGGKKVVNHCSKGYQLVPNSDIVNPLMEAFKGMDIEIQGSQRWDSRFDMNIVFKDKSLDLKSAKGDFITPKLKIRNSYDGRVRYSYAMGYWRLICSNGLVIPAEGLEHLNTQLTMRHTPSLEEHVNPGYIREMVEGFIEAGKEITKPYEELAKKKVKDLEERVHEVISETKFSTRRGEDVLDRIQEEMKILKGTPNDWMVYNGFNYQLNHSTEIKMDAHKKEKVDQQVLSYLLNN